MSKFVPISLDDAAQVLLQGGVVGVPSETVYGLAADATRSDAVAGIFALKNRPSTNPLIVHCKDAAHAKSFARDWPKFADALAEAFWPGPLTMVVRKSDSIPDIVSAGLNTVALRVPSHPIFQALLSRLDFPLAAPSANKSNHISPTCAQHVRDEFGDSVPVLDGGACDVGIESTVIDLTTFSDKLLRPKLLRPGSISRAQIEAVIGPIDAFVGEVSPNVAASSPGQHAQHYAPRAPALRFTRNTPPIPKLRSCAIVIGALPESMRVPELLHFGVLSSDPKRAAAKLYSVMRYLDNLSPSAIYIELPPDAPEWVAVRDRIMRATR